MTLVRLRNNDYLPGRRSYHNADDMFNWFASEMPAFGGCSTYPLANVLESEDDFRIELMVPGYKKDEIRVQVENGMLSISHEPSDNGEEKAYKYVSREFSQKAFSRKFKLSDRLNSGKIAAKYENGVLNISIPKKEEAKAKPVQEISIS